MSINPIALRKAKITYNFGLSECNRVNTHIVYLTAHITRKFVNFMVGYTILQKEDLTYFVMLKGCTKPKEKYHKNLHEGWHIFNYFFLF